VQRIADVINDARNSRHRNSKPGALRRATVSVVIKRRSTLAKYVRLQDLVSPVAADCETTGLNSWLGDRPFAFSFTDCKGQRAYIRFEVDPFTRKVLYTPKRLKRLKRFFANPDMVTIWHNGKFDHRMLQSIDIVVRGRSEETMFAAHACNTLEPTLALKPLAKKYCDIPMDDQKELQAATVKARHLGKKLGWKLADSVQADYWMADPALCERYAVIDTDRTMMLWLLYDSIMDEEGVRGTYERELRLAPVTFAMEGRGIRMSRKIVNQEIRTHTKAMKEEVAKLREWNPAINLRSSQQLLKYVYGKKSKGNLGLPPQYQGMHAGIQGSGKLSLDFKCRRRLHHPFTDGLTKLRAHEKALSGFFRKYLKLAVRDKLSGTGWVMHADFQQVGPVTGRFSCRNPNLQNVASNITTRSTEPINARLPFGPRKGYVWYHFDYSQLEVRIFASVAGEQTLLAAIKSGRDMHTECANKAWGGKDNPNALEKAAYRLGLSGGSVGAEKLVIREVQESCKRAGVKFKGPEASYDDAEQQKIANAWLAKYNYDIAKAEAEGLEKKNTRTDAKFVLFLKVFGGGVKAAAEQIECDYATAEKIINDYDDAFPRIKEFLYEQSNKAKRDGFIVNKFGRKLRIDPDKAYRAVNYEVQSDAADLMKDRMIAVEQELKKLRKTGRVEAYQVLTIHDEIVIEVKKEHTYPWFLRRVKRIMEDHGGRFDIDLNVDVARVRKSWGQKDVEKVTL
jgi:DNA polymerase I-like protein with 3'-5' exonuclease and polymerase domains